MKAVFKFNCPCGRMGDVTGVFVSTVKKVSDLMNSNETVHFGEVLGKHSEVSIEMLPALFKLVSTSPEVVRVVEDFYLTSGINPFDYLEE